MASTRPRSPLELPPRKPAHEPAHARQVESVEPSLQMTRMPISFGVLMLSLGVTCLMCLSASALLYRNAAARGEALRHTTEQHMDGEVAQLRAAVSRLQTQLDLRTRDLAEQAREIERVSAALESVRGLRGAEARSVRLRREKH